MHRDRVRLAALCSTNPAVLAAWSAELGGVATYTDYHDLFAAADIDAVDLCLPHDLHRDALVAAARAGKHVLCEKPLCVTSAEADAIAAAVAAAGITVMCAHNQLHLPGVKRARDLIEAGAVGDLFRVRAADTFRLPGTGEDLGWRADPGRAGGGVLIDTGYHPTYLLRYLAGEVPSEATAVLSRHRMSLLPAEDTAQVVYRFGGGAVGLVETSWAYARPSGAERFSVVGSRGWIWSDDHCLRVSCDGRPEEAYDLPEVDTVVAEIGAFADALAGGSRPPHTHVEGIEVLRMILAAYRSADGGRSAPVS